MQLYCNTIVTETGLRAEKDGVTIQKLYCGEQWQRQGAGLGSRHAQGRWGAGERAGGAGRACWGRRASVLGRAGARAGVCSGLWGVRQGVGRAGVAWTGALQANG